MTVDDSGVGHGTPGTCAGATRAGGFCALAAGWGTEHVGIGRCRKHGGNTPTHVISAKRAQADALVAGMLFVKDAPPIKDAVGSALRLAGQLEVMVERLGLELNDGLEGDDRALRAKAAFWERLLGHFRSLLVEIARLRLGDRLVELEADKVKLAAVAFGRALDAGELSLEVRELVTRVFLAELRAGLPEIEGAES